MTKNDNSESKQTVRVFGADGELIGATYPKRAAGLVKKGRAQYVCDFDIRLIASDVTNFTEETEMDNNTISLSKQEQPTVNRIFFNAREWSPNKDCPHNVASRSFMQGPDGVIAEAYTIGDWGYNWTEIVSKTLTLPKNTLHTFTFWLNGGENDQYNEVCRFEAVFNNDYENRYTYNLNRNYIKPLKKLNGWELYEIPFMTADNEYTQLRFVAQRAYMTVMAAKEPAAYADIPDATDEFEGLRPQRHNVIFPDGWPANTAYSTQRLRAKYGENGDGAKQPEPRIDFAQSSENAADSISGSISEVAGALSEIAGQISDMLNGVISPEKISETVKQAVLQAGTKADVDDIVDEIMSELSDSIEDLADSISDEIEDMTDEIEGMLDEVQSAIEDMQDD